MKPAQLLTIFCLIITISAACAPRQVRPVSEIDPSTMFERIQSRRDSFGKGLSGVLETEFKQDRRHFRGKAYIIAFPDGAFRLEIPGPMGSTLMVMVNNGKEVKAYYPEKGKAYLSDTDGVSINPHLPFPLPVETGMLTALLLGTVPEGDNFIAIKAHLLESGERRLTAECEGSGLKFTYTFEEGQNYALRLVTARGNGVDLEVTTRRVQPYLPETFELAFPDIRISGSWEKISFFDGDATVLNLDIPGSVTVTDLRDLP